MGSRNGGGAATCPMTLTKLLESVFAFPTGQNEMRPLADMMSPA